MEPRLNSKLNDKVQIRCADFNKKRTSTCRFEVKKSEVKIMRPLQSSQSSDQRMGEIVKL